MSDLPAPPTARATVKGYVLVLAQALPIMAVVSLFPVVPQLVQRFGTEPHAQLLVPMVITLPSFCIALFSPLAGWLADRFGRRPVFLTALLAYAIVGLGPLVLSDLVLIVASRALLGVAEAVIVTVANALMADYFGEDRYRWLALQSALGSALGTVLIALGGTLAEVSWRGPFVVYAAAVPLFILAVACIDEPVLSAAGVTGLTPAKRFPWRAAFTVGVVSFLASALYYVEPTNFANVLTARAVTSTGRIGLIQAGTSIAYIAGAFIYRRLARGRVGRQLGLAGVLVGSGMLGIGLSSSVAAAAGWAVVQQLGGGMVIPALTGWAQGSVLPEERGRAMGIWATFFFGGLFVSPALVTTVATMLGGLSVAFTLLGIATVGLAVLATLFIRSSAATPHGRPLLQQGKFSR